MLATADLVMLPLAPSAPAPAPTTFVVRNATGTVRRVLHPDPFNTLFVELSFPAGSLASLGGVPLLANDSVTVTVTPLSGLYGFTLSPAQLVFARGSEPTARLVYAEYGDLAAGAGSYASPSEFAAALDLWFEIGVDRWRRTAGSGPAGLDAVAGRLAEAGTFVVAAPR